MFSRFNCRAREKAIFKAHSLAIVLEILPSFLSKLEIHSSLLLCSTLRPPTFLGFPKLDSSVLSLTQLGMGFFHLTWTWVLFGLLELSGTIAKNSAPFLIQWEYVFESILPDWKINLFRWSHISYIALGVRNLPMHMRLREKWDS